MSALWTKRKLRRTALLMRLHRKGPARVFAELLWIRHESGRKYFWESFCFREIFGDLPRRILDGPVQPICPSDHTVQEWLATRPKKPRR